MRAASCNAGTYSFAPDLLPDVEARHVLVPCSNKHFRVNRICTYAVCDHPNTTSSLITLLSLRFYVRIAFLEFITPVTIKDGLVTIQGPITLIATCLIYLPFPLCRTRPELLYFQHYSDSSTIFADSCAHSVSSGSFEACCLHLHLSGEVHVLCALALTGLDRTLHAGAGLLKVVRRLSRINGIRLHWCNSPKRPVQILIGNSLRE